MLKIRGLYKTFNPATPDEILALRGIDLEITKGSFTIVIGTNGSGKSTLLNAIAGTFLPDEGGIEIDGKKISRWPEYRCARWIGRVFQNPFSGTAPHMTVAENLALAACRGKIRGLGLALSRARLREFKERIRTLNMGLEERLGSEIGTLSGGQRQALTLLMAVWGGPRLLLLDEHTAALDPKTAEQVIRLTREVIRGLKLTTVMVTHSMHQAVHLGDRLIMMHQGRIIYDVSGNEKSCLRAEDLIERFEEVRRSDQLDTGACELLRAVYV
jgi:putative ABC transport system ATP-binding protein